MIFIADESVDMSIVHFLRTKNFEVFAITEISPGIPDDEVIELAFKRNALLITFDKDFGDLTIRFGKDNHGIILVRLSGLPVNKKSEILHKCIAKYGNDLYNSFTVIGHKNIRIRRLPV